MRQTFDKLSNWKGTLPVWVKADSLSRSSKSCFLFTISNRVLHSFEFGSIHNMSPGTSSSACSHAINFVAVAQEWTLVMCSATVVHFSLKKIMIMMGAFHQVRLNLVQQVDKFLLHAWKDWLTAEGFCFEFLLEFFIEVYWSERSKTKDATFCPRGFIKEKM